MLLGRELYRQLIREARHLPDSRMSDHYLERIRSSFRQPPPPESSAQAVRRVKHAQKLLRHLQAANDGYPHALTRAFETAYGVRGAAKHAALAPFLAPGLASRTFPPPLAALVTSPTSHLSRPPSPSQLLVPPTLPDRADPSSDAARLLGPLTRERERAVRRRWWNVQTGKVRPPLAVRVRRGGEDVTDVGDARGLLERVGLRGISEEALRAGWDKLDELERKATTAAEVPPHGLPLPPRRLQTPSQRAAAAHPLPSPSSSPPPRKPAPPQLRILPPSSHATKWHLPKHLTPRFMRRRAAALLEHAPVLVVHVPSAGGPERAEEERVRFEVRRSDRARGERGGVREATDEERWWLEWGAQQQQQQQGASPQAGGKGKARGAGASKKQR